jgi:hypothetical protein
MTVSADDRAFDVGVEDGIPVGLPSGATFYVLTRDEADYLGERVTRYLDDNHFVNVSDFQDIDKMVTFELFIHRWSLWLSKGRDYYNEDINQKQLADTIASYSHELRQLKKNLGIDKPARDRQHGDDSVPAYLDSLRQRAREFGYHRNAQFAKIIESFQRINAMLTYHDNCNDIERLERQCTIDDVVDVVRAEISAFEALDEKFRTEVQTIWIRKQ